MAIPAVPLPPALPLFLRYCAMEFYHLYDSHFTYEATPTKCTIYTIFHSVRGNVIGDFNQFSLN